jgi:hypothetical protein
MSGRAREGRTQVCLKLFAHVFDLIAVGIVHFQQPEMKLWP